MHEYIVQSTQTIVSAKIDKKKYPQNEFFQTVYRQTLNTATTKD